MHVSTGFSQETRLVLAFTRGRASFCTSDLGEKRARGGSSIELHCAVRRRWADGLARRPRGQRPATRGSRGGAAPTMLAQGRVSRAPRVARHPAEPRHRPGRRGNAWPVSAPVAAAAAARPAGPAAVRWPPGRAALSPPRAASLPRSHRSWPPAGANNAPRSGTATSAAVGVYPSAVPPPPPPRGDRDGRRRRTTRDGTQRGTSLTRCRMRPRAECTVSPPPTVSTGARSPREWTTGGNGACS